MTAMSEWACALVAEVKAAAPNAPEPIFSVDDGETYYWHSPAKHAIVSRFADREEHCIETVKLCWWHGGTDSIYSGAEEERQTLGLMPRAYFIKLVRETWH